MASTRDSNTKAEQISVGFMFQHLRRHQNPKISFDILFPSMTVKRSPVVYMSTCSYCVFIIKVIVFCC